MFSFLNRYVFKSNEEIWMEWIEWQKNQNYFHYQKYGNICEYYKNNKYINNYIKSINKNDEKTIYFSYCFGDFLPLFLLSNEKIDKYKFIEMEKNKEQKK